MDRYLALRCHGCEGVGRRLATSWSQVSGQHSLYQDAVSLVRAHATSLAGLRFLWSFRVRRGGLPVAGNLHAKPDGGLRFVRRARHPGG